MFVTWVIVTVIYYCVITDGTCCRCILASFSYSIAVVIFLSSSVSIFPSQEYQGYKSNSANSYLISNTWAARVDFQDVPELCSLSFKFRFDCDKLLSSF
jgi:hypothetical protein